MKCEVCNKDKRYFSNSKDFENICIDCWNKEYFEEEIVYISKKQLKELADKLEDMNFALPLSYQLQGKAIYKKLKEMAGEE